MRDRDVGNVEIRAGQHAIGVVAVDRQCVEPGANERGRGCISPAGRSPSVWVLATDEERVIAAATLAAIRRPAARPAALA